MALIPFFDVGPGGRLAKSITYRSELVERSIEKAPAGRRP